MVPEEGVEPSRPQGSGDFETIQKPPRHRKSAAYQRLGAAASASSAARIVPAGPNSVPTREAKVIDA